jgi:hypothetical protein
LDRNYWDMMNAATELQGFSGYLTSQEKNERDKQRGVLKAAVNAFVYRALQEPLDVDDLKASIHGDFDSLKEKNGPGWHGIVDEVSEQVMHRIDRESTKSPLLRKAIRWSPVAFTASLVVAYLVVAVTQTVKIDQPLESQIGLVQRAKAAQKALRYDDWMPNRRRWVAELLFWPISPSEEELKGAREFVGLVLDGHAVLVENKMICGELINGSGQSLSDEQVKLIGDVATYLQQDKVSWSQRPVMTVLEPIKTAFPCSLAQPQ